MTSALDPTLVDYCRRLGLQKEPALLKLAQERLRLLGRCGTVTACRVSSTCQTVLALHLASTSGKQEQQVNVKDAAKLSGMKRDKYQNLMENVRKELGLTKIVTVEEVAVKLGCAQKRKEAADVLGKFSTISKSKMSASARRNANFNKSKYVCAAVAVVCQGKNKVKLDKAKLAELSGVTKRELDALVKSMAETIKDEQKETSEEEDRDVAAEIAKTPNKKRPAEVTANGGGSSSKSYRLNVDVDEDFEFDMEEYEQWKAKILKQAGIKV